MIDSLKKPERVVASVLITLIRSSRDLTYESKNVELKGTSALKLDRDNLLENEKRTSGFSQLHSRVLLLDFSADKMMNDKTNVFIVYACYCVQKENVELKYNMILETVGKHNISRRAG